MGRQEIIEAYEETVGVRLRDEQVAELFKGAADAVAVLAQLPGFIIRAAARSVYGRHRRTLPLAEWAQEAELEQGRREQVRRAQIRGARQPRDEVRVTGGTRGSGKPKAFSNSKPLGRKGTNPTPAQQEREAWEAQLERWRKRRPPLRVLLNKIDEAAAIGNFSAVLQVAEIGAAATGGHGDPLPTIAKRVAGAYLRAATSLEQIPDVTLRAKSHLARHRIGTRALPEEVEARLDAIAVLLADETVFGRTKLCSLLRQVNRPELAVEAVEPFGGDHPDHAAALTTCAAALADLKRLPEARGRAEKAWGLCASPEAACVLSRISRLDRNVGIALKWAQEGWSRQRNRFTARSLAAAAALANDEPALAAASAWLGQHPDEGEHPSAYIAVRAGWILLQDGDAQGAMKVAQRVLESVPGYSPAELLLRDAKGET